MFGGEVAVFLVDAGQFDALDIVGIGGTDFFDHGEPRFGHAEISDCDIGLIFPQFVEAGEAVEKHPVGGKTVGEIGRILIGTAVPRRCIFRVAVGTCVETDIEKCTEGGGVSTVTGAESVLGDLQLFAIRFEVRTVCQSLIEIAVDRGQVGIFVFVIGGEFDICGQDAFGIAHQDGQSIDGGIVLIFGGNEVAVSGIHLDFKVQHVAQRNGTGLIFQTGIAEQSFLINAVFAGDADVFNGQQHFIVGTGNGIHERAAGVGFEVGLIIHRTILDLHIEFAGKTVKEQPCCVNAGIGLQRNRMLGTVNERFAVADPAAAAVEIEICGNRGRISSEGLIITHAGCGNSVICGDVGRIVDDGDTLGISQSQLFDPFEKVFVGFFDALAVCGLRKSSRRFGVFVTSASQKNESGNTGLQKLLFHFSLLC